MFDWGNWPGDWFWGWFGLDYGSLDNCQTDWQCHGGGGGVW